MENNLKKDFNKNREKTKTDRTISGFKKWTSFYRANPHRFAEDYFGLHLHLFQKILLFMMGKNDYFMYIASRGQGKSYLIAIFCIVQCVLFPMTKVIIASGTKGQAQLIITEKIAKDLIINYPNIKREIKEIKTGVNDCVVIFHNGSTMTAVVSGANARGYRGNILICDEFRLIKLENITNVLRPFLNVKRQPPYLTKPQYAHLGEENKEIYISSAWFKNSWIWDRFKAYIKSMLDKKDYFVCDLDYNLSMHHGLLSEKRIEDIKNEPDMDEMSFSMEMGGLFFGEAEKAYFKLSELQECQTLSKPMHPLTTFEFIDKASGKKAKAKLPPKQTGEIRLLSMDIAMMSNGDNTIFTFMRLIPEGEVYKRYVPYIESINGQHSKTQSIRLKQLFYDLECDFCVMDTNGVGLSVFDDCSTILYDDERDIEYEPWTCMNVEAMENRAYDKNALPLIYSIKATAQMNHEMAMSLKKCLESRKMQLLLRDNEAKDMFIEKKDYLNLGEEERHTLMKTFIQTTLLVNEMVSLEGEYKNGLLRLTAVGRNRKDRYSSLAYCNYYADLLEKNLKSPEDENIFDYLIV